MPIWLSVSLVVVAAVAVTGVILFLIDQLNRTQEISTTENTADTKEKAINR